jgi:hypothetical protein
MMLRLRGKKTSRLALYAIGRHRIPDTSKLLWVKAERSTQIGHVHPHYHYLRGYSVANATALILIIAGDWLDNISALAP